MNYKRMSDESIDDYVWRMCSNKDNKIYELTATLIVFPEKFPIDPLVNNPVIRFAVIWDFKIVYAIDKNSIVILRVFSTRQNPKKLKPWA